MVSTVLELVGIVLFFVCLTLLGGWLATGLAAGAVLVAVGYAMGEQE